MAASRRLCGQSARPTLTAVSPAIRQAPIAPRARGFWLDRGRKHHGTAARSGPGRQTELPDIAVPEIPVDEEERPLPPPKPLARNALVDGPILRTLLWLACANRIALSAGTCVVIAETSYIGRLGVESLAAQALGFPFGLLSINLSEGATD